MINQLRKNPAVLKAALGLVTILFCAGLLLPNSQSTTALNGKRQLNQQKTQQHAQTLVENHQLSEPEAFDIAIAQALQKIQLSNQIEEIGIQPSKSYLKTFISEAKINPKDIGPQHFQDLNDDAALNMLIKGIENSSLPTKISHTTIKSQHNRQRIIDIDLSNASYAVDMSELKAFHQDMSNPPTTEASIHMHYVRIPNDFSSNQIHLIRKYIFQNPKHIDAVAQEFNLSVEEYTGPIPQYLPSDLSDQAWVKKSYVSDIIEDDTSKQFVQVIEQTTPAKLSFEKALAQIKAAYIQSQILPKILIELSQTTDLDAVMDKYKLKSKERNTTNLPHVLFNSPNRSNIRWDSDDLHWEKLVGHQKTTNPAKNTWRWGSIESYAIVSELADGSSQSQ
ncbi:hypothetical protein OAT84_01210 [Gammaproteobacteria bacterium]|nr:hypothetical protein [Gammaproteobacteria bacterium]